MRLPNSGAPSNAALAARHFLDRFPLASMRAGGRDAAVLALLAASVRRPVELPGDPESCFAAWASGAPRVATTRGGFDQPGLVAVAARTAFAAWPGGSWHAEMLTDGHDTPLRLACTLTLDGGDTRVRTC